MDGLMSEATDLILSCEQNLVIGPNKILTWESRRSSQDSTDSNSVTMLRLSITKSIKDRHSRSEVVDISTLTQKKSKRRKGSYSGKPKIDIQQLNTKVDTFYAESSAFIAKENNHLEEPNKSDVPDIAFTKLFAEGFDADERDQLETRETEMSENNNNNNDNDNRTAANDKEQTVRKNVVENGLKLARRNFSDSIFENCSTYSLSCPEVLQERDNGVSSKGNFATRDNHSFVDKSSKIDSMDVSYLTESKKSSSADSDNCSDDQISLSDSFFVNVNSEDNVSQSSLFSKESECSNTGKKSSRLSLSKENDLPLPEDITHDNTEQLHQKGERRLSKKWRKRQRKNKSKDVPTYECPKCGVSYILSTNASNSTACCLHCDFWESVEPVFLKREKQPWNTCRIC